MNVVLFLGALGQFFNNQNESEIEIVIGLF